MKKKLAAFLCGVLALAMVGGSFAFYTATNEVDNQLKTQKYGDVLEEKFTPKDDWQPGEEVTKEAGVKNTGDYDLVVRIKLDETWTLKNGSTVEISSADGNDITTYSQTSATDGLVTGDKSVVEKELAATGWTKGTDGYWYYNTKLGSGQDTGNFIKKLTLKEDADMGYYTNKNYWTESATVAATEPSAANIGTDSKTKWVEYTGAVPKPTVSTNDVYTKSVSTLDDTKPGYAGATYDLVITSETCQATDDAVTASWTTVPAAVKSGWDL